MKVLPFLLIFTLASTAASAEVSTISPPQQPVGSHGREITLPNGEKINLDAPPSTRKVDPKLIATEKLKLAQDSGKWTRHDYSFCEDTYRWLNENMNDSEWNRIEGMWGRACL